MNPYESIKLCQPVLGETPKRFNTIDVAGARSNFVFTVVHAIGLVISHIQQTIISVPTIPVDDTTQAYFPTYNALQGVFFRIRNNLRIYMASALKYAKYSRFARSSASMFIRYTAGFEVGFVYFNRPLNGNRSFAPKGNFTTKSSINYGYRTTGKFCQLCGIRCGQIHRKIPQQSLEFLIRNFGTLIIFVIHCITIFYK